MPKRLSPEIPLILSVVAQLLAVGAVLWLIWPLRVGPVYYSEVSIVEVEGLGGSADVVRAVGVDIWGDGGAVYVGYAGVEDGEVGGVGGGRASGVVRAGD